MALIIIVPLVVSFGKPKSKYASDRDLIGIWIPAEDSLCLKRRKILPNEGFCMEFKENGDLFIRELHGYGCGYGIYSKEWVDFTGTWCRLNDSIIQTPGKYWRDWLGTDIIIHRKSRNEISIKPAPAKVKIMGKTFTVE